MSVKFTPRAFSIKNSLSGYVTIPQFRSSNADDKKDESGDDKTNDKSDDKKDDKSDDKKGDDKKEEKDDKKDEKPDKGRVIHRTQKQLDELAAKSKEQAVIDFIKELGAESKEDIEAKLKLLSEKDPTEIEKLLNQKVSTAEGKALSLLEKVNEQALELEVYKAASKAGFNNPRYGLFEYKEHLDGLSEDELKSASASKFFASIKDDEKYSEFFGKEVLDTSKNNNNDKKADDKVGDKTDPLDVYNMSPAEFRKYRQSKYNR